MTTPAPTSTPPAPQEEHRNRWLYWSIAIVVIALAVIGLFTYNTEKNNQEAIAKAQSLSQKFSAAGLAVPKQETLVRVFGTDGGAVCDNPANALGKATLIDSLFNGAGFVGRRPVIVDRQILRGELLILQTYCPDKLPKYQEFVDKLKTDDTVKK